MSIGPWQILLILVIVLIIFGAGKLPRVAGDLAKGIKNFKKGMTDDSGAAEATDATDAAAANTNKAIDTETAEAEPAVEKDKAAQG